MRRETFYRAAPPASRDRTRAPRASSSPSTCPTCCATAARRARPTSCTSSGWPCSTSTRCCPRCAQAARPLVLTAHDILPREPRPGQRRAQRRLYERFDAVVVHSEHGRRAADRRARASTRARVHVIPHGAFAHLAARASPSRRCRAELARRERPVVLCFGLMRPYKGIDAAARGLARASTDAELWIVGMPRMDIAALRAGAPAGRALRAALRRRRRAAALLRRADLRRAALPRDRPVGRALHGARRSASRCC